MCHAKYQNHSHCDSGEFILKVFDIYCPGGHLGHVTKSFIQIRVLALYGGSIRNWDLIVKAVSEMFCFTDIYRVQYSPGAGENTNPKGPNANGDDDGNGDNTEAYLS